MTPRTPPPGSAPGAAAAAPPDVETASEAYARRFAGPVGEWLLSVQTAALRELLAPFPSAVVLDVGGGHAQAAVPLVAIGHPVVVTGSRVECRARPDRLLAPGSFAFVTAPSDALPFPARSFAVVVALRLLAHAADWEGLLGELCRVARGAVVLDYAPNIGLHRLAGGLFGAKRAVERDTRPYRRLAPAALRSALARQGWETAAERPQLLLPLALHRLLRAPLLSRRCEAAAARLGLTRRWGAPVLVRARPRP